MKVLVTGGAGFIGSHIVERLLTEGMTVVVVDNSPNINDRWPEQKVIWYQMDLLDEKLLNVFSKEKPQVIIHLAAQTSVQSSVKRPHNDAETNIVGTIHLLQCAVTHNVQKIVFASTAAVYGEPQYLPICEDHQICPTAFYGLSKYAAELYIRQYHKLFGLSYSILRFSNVYGPGQTDDGEGGVISIFLSQIAKDCAPTIFGDGQQTRDFIFVGDVVDACVKAMFVRESHILNISSHTKLSINDLLAMLKLQINSDIKPKFQCEKDGDIRHSCLDNSLAIETLTWRPVVSLNEGLEKTITSMLDHDM